MSKKIKDKIIPPVKCPYCGSEDVEYSPPPISGKKKYRCNKCGRAFWG